MIGDSGIPYAERQPRTDALTRQIPPLELQEEALIEAAEAEGIALSRRGDADPQAILLMQWAGQVQQEPEPEPEQQQVAAE